jgi:hypothetical protein
MWLREVLGNLSTPMAGIIPASGRRELPRLRHPNKRQVAHGVGRVA